MTDYPLGSRYRIEHDGFQGAVIGYYTTHEGKQGVVLQQDGTRVVHVYGVKWLIPVDETCPTPCDDDCDMPCHEWHQPRHKQEAGHEGHGGPHK